MLELISPVSAVDVAAADTRLLMTPAALRPQAHEALRRAKFKFAGRQKIVASRNW